MNAALLNSSRRGAGTLNAGPEVDIPRDPGFDTTWESVAGGVVVSGPPQPSEGLDLARLQSWAESGQKLLDAGKNPGMTVNPSALLAAVTAGAVAGSTIPGVGTVVGAIVAGVVYVATALIGGAFGPGPSIYDNAGANVHWWFTNYAPEGYLQWVISTGSNSPFASVQAAAQGYLVWLLQTYGWVAMPPPYSWQAHAGYTLGNPPYSRLDYDYVWDATGIAAHEAKIPWLQDFYANFGVDWMATRDAWLSNGVGGPILLKNRQFLTDEELAAAAENDGTASNGKQLAAGLGITLAALALMNKS